MSRPEFRGHQVRITVVDQQPAVSEGDDWLKSLHQMATNGVRITRPADDNRESIYEGTECPTDAGRSSSNDVLS